MPARADLPRRTKIVATLGPATDGLETELIRAGMDVARLNFSHGTPEEHARRCSAIRAAARACGRPVAVMQDLQGPKIRVGELAGGGPVHLHAGQELRITSDQVPGTADRIPCTYAGLPRDVRSGDTLLLDDGRLRLTALSTDGREVVARVEVGGDLGEHKGINLPGVAVSAPSLTEKDCSDLGFGLRELDVDYVALSFVRSASDLGRARDEMARLGRTAPLIAKIEKPEAVHHLDPILASADAVMVARGDLGVEIGPELVPAVQKTIVQHANRRGVPAITATQMLESLVEAETPTRAEASDVANAVWDGTDAVMLSEETAVGAHPVLAVQVMARVVSASEKVASPGSHPRPQLGRSGAGAIAEAAHALAEGLDARAIAGYTRTGRTADLLATRRPGVPIFAFSPDERVCRRLALRWGVTPISAELGADLESSIAAVISALTERGDVAGGDRLVIVGSHPFRPGIHTNFVKYQVVRGPRHGGAATGAEA